MLEIYIEWIMNVKERSVSLTALLLLCMSDCPLLCKVENLE